jgi:hypothetical protein
LVGEKVAHVAVLHNDDDEVGCWFSKFVLENDVYCRTMFGCSNFRIISIYWSMYFCRKGFFLTKALLMVLTAYNFSEVSNSLNSYFPEQV